MPDGVIYKPCGNRRAAVCPSCAEVYQPDAYQLVRAGLVGGKGVPDSVAAHPRVFLTLTAPRSVRSTPDAPPRRAAPPLPTRPPRPTARPARTACGWPATDPPRRRRPAARAAAVPGLLRPRPPGRLEPHAGELWRRTTNAADRAPQRLGERYGAKLRLRFAKVAEIQRRGVVHFHALIRLDGLDPDDPDAILAPPPRCRCPLASRAARADHPRHPVRLPDRTPTAGGWPIGWGSRSTSGPSGDLDDAARSPTAVAGYLAKYATKATEITGHASTRLTADTVAATPTPSTHTGRLIDACWRLGAPGCDADPSGQRGTPAALLRPAPPLGAHARLRRPLLHQEPALLHHPPRPAPGPPRLAPPRTTTRARSTTTPPSSSGTSPTPAPAGTPSATPSSPTPPPPKPANTVE